jgi:hypothetical protein
MKRISGVNGYLQKFNKIGAAETCEVLKTSQVCFGSSTERKKDEPAYVQKYLGYPCLTN